MSYAGQTSNEYWATKKDFKRKESKNENQREIPLKKTLKGLNVDQIDFIKEFGNNFNGYSKYKEFGKAWQKKFKDKVPSRQTFFNYTDSKVKTVKKAFIDAKIKF